MKKRPLPPFDRYEYYHKAVQSTEADCQFISDAYKKIRGKRPHDLREDFCGGFALCCEWVRRNKDNHAIGIDLDPEPLEYGRTHYLPKLRAEQASRIKTVQGSVLTTSLRPVDVEIAFNFSYYIFKSRMMLRRYFKKAHKGLRNDGLFILDCFGGYGVMQKNQESSKIRNFTYYWDQTNYDPVTANALFHIHFKRKGEAKREKVFSYDWRLWTIPELREALLESGFRKTRVFWEGTRRNGTGDGKFKEVERGEDCTAWVSYIVAEK